MPLTVIRASAGSGKTYQLAVWFIRILLRGELDGKRQDPAAILATTFTRAAAGEILDRVLRLLAQAVLSMESREQLAAQLGLPLTQADSERLLACLAGRLDRLAVSTMDAFFAQIAKAFAGELGLAPNWQMAVNEAEADLLRQTLYAMLDQAELKSLMDALWTFRRSIGSSVQETLGKLAGMLASLETPDGSPVPFRRPDTRRWRAEDVTAARGLLAQNDEWIPRTQKGDPSKQWTKPITLLHDSLHPGNDVLELLEATLAERVFSGGEYFKKPIPSVLRDAVAPLLLIACEALREQHRARTSALAWLARRYQKCRRKAAFGAGAYTFSDVAITVARHALQTQELYFRLGTKFEHVLFDEFQDTSRLQFAFFRPLIEEIGGSGGAVLVVGDEKQAIYGWRGGDRELMHGPMRELARQIDEATVPPLNRSFRSSPAVLDAVNRTFGALAGQWLDAEDEGKRVFLDAGKEWSSGFAAHESDEKVRNLRGMVRRFEVAEHGDDHAEGDANRPLISKALDIVSGHLQQDPRRKIALLLRKNKLMPQIIAEIRRAHPEVDVSGEGGNPLTDSRAVELLLALLTCLDHPGHTAARHLVLDSPVAPAFGFPATMRAGDSPGLPEWHVFRDLRRTLMDAGYASVIRDWIRHPAFVAHCNDHDLQRCEQLLEVAREFEGCGALRPGEFVAHVRTRRVERPGGSGVRVMTIHASKGLEFEAVILMELDAAQGGGGEPSLGIFEGTLQVVPSKKDAPYLDMVAMLEAQARQDFMEELSVLYVGMTRARSFLDIILRENAAAPLACLLRHALPVDAERIVEQRDGLPMRDCDAASGRMSAGPPPNDPGIATGTEGPVRGGAISFSARPLHSTPSSREEGGAVNIAQILAPTNRAAMRRGELIHAWLAQITWIEDGLPVIETLLASTAGIAGELSREQIEVWATRLLDEARSTGTELHAALSNPPDAPELWRERRFAVVHETPDGPELLTGSFDRVLLWRDAAGKVRRAQILDFKTDRFSSPEERGRIEARYAPQLDAYRNALCMLCPDLDAGAVRSALALIRGGDFGAA
jgi:ATP-dependent exoDNAse (exonuclease V) beta subunit